MYHRLCSITNLSYSTGCLGFGWLWKDNCSWFLWKVIQETLQWRCVSIQCTVYASTSPVIKNHIACLTDIPSSPDAKFEEDYQVFLSLLAAHGNVLIIFDSCDKLSIIDYILPTENTACHVIITTKYNKGSSLLDR